MQQVGSAEATKQLRSRTDPISSRVELAEAILEERIDVVLPRKQTVILEWAFDMLGIDPSARSSARLWSLISRVWPQTPRDARLRILKNHKFATNLSEALASESSDHIGFLAVALGSVLQDFQIFVSAQSPQARQLVLAYLNNAYGNKELGDMVFAAVKSQVRLFGKSDASVIMAILNEPIKERMLYYLTDYMSTSSNSAVPPPGFAGSFKLFAEAICEANVLLRERIIALGQSYPSRIPEFLAIVNAKRPNEVNADLLEELAKLSFAQNYTDWGFANLCLEINPAPLLVNEDNRRRLISSDCPDVTLALIIEKSTHLRILTDFLSSWEPIDLVPDVVFDSLCRAVDTLAPLQVSNVLENAVISNSKMLKLITQVMSYQLASSPLVSKKLDHLLMEPGVEPSVKKAVLDVRSQAHTKKPSKHDNPQLALRVVELKPELVDIVSSIVKRLDDGDDIILRYFPVLETALDENKLRKLMSKVSKEAKHKLALSPHALECIKISSALIESSLDAQDLEVLAALPKQIFSWDQRHRTVSRAINSEVHDSRLTSEILIKLLDSQRPPAPKDMGQWICSLAPTGTDISTIGLLTRALKKDPEYIDSMINATSEFWQKLLIKCYAAEVFDTQLIDEASSWLQSTLNDRNMLEVLVTVLSLLPQSELTRKFVAYLVLAAISEVNSLPSRLFELACSYNYSWAVVSALYLFTEGMEREFAQHCRSLNPDELNLLVLTAADERQLKILQALVDQKVLVTCPTHQLAISVALFKSTEEKNTSNPDFWILCDKILRETPTLLTQFSLDNLLEFLASSDVNAAWNELALLTSRILLFRRQATRGRIHLIIAILTRLLRGVECADQAHLFARLVDNLCNPPNHGSRSLDSRTNLSSQVAKERRHISRHAGVLLQNLVHVMLRNAGNYEDWSAVSAALRPGLFILVDLIFGSGLKAVSAGMDAASRAYLRSVFEDYKLHSRWVSD